MLDRGVKLLAIDAYAMDVSPQTMREAAARDEPRYFPLHFVGRARPVAFVPERNSAEVAA